jgi:hypothetical protein
MRFLRLPGRRTERVPTRVINPTPRDNLYALIGLFIDGQIEARHFSRMFSPLLKEALARDLLTANEVNAFQELRQSIGWEGPFPGIQMPTDLGPLQYNDLLQAALRCRDTLVDSERNVEVAEATSSDQSV